MKRLSLVLVVLALLVSVAGASAQAQQEPWETWLQEQNFSEGDPGLYPEFLEANFETSIDKVITVEKGEVALAWGTVQVNDVFVDYAVLGEGSYYVKADAVRTGTDNGKCQLGKKFFPEYWQQVLLGLYPEKNWEPVFYGYPTIEDRNLYCVFLPTISK